MEKNDKDCHIRQEQDQFHLKNPRKTSSWDMLISWMFNVLNPEIRGSVMYTDTAKGIWDELEAYMVDQVVLSCMQHRKSTTLSLKV